MALEGPQLHYARSEGTEDTEAQDTIAQALELAHRIEELLEASPSVHLSTKTPTKPESAAADLRSTRMARAMAASLIDELEALVRGTRKTGAA